MKHKKVARFGLKQFAIWVNLQQVPAVSIGMA
jgi:hypothetical protein